MMILSCMKKLKKQMVRLFLLLGPGWPVDAGKMEDMICDLQVRSQFVDLFGSISYRRSLWWEARLGSKKSCMGNRAISALKRHLFSIKALMMGRPVMRYQYFVEEMPEGFEVTACSTG